MLIFPQLSTGAWAQYPTGKKLSQRSVQSAMEDGTLLSLADTAATYLRWKVILQNLSDQEASAYTTFFLATQGNLQPFLFLDPTANLLLWSEDFTQSAWTSSGVTFDSNVADPFGGSAAQRAHNQTPAALSIAQQTQIPGTIQTCFSIYLRSDSPVTASLILSAGSQSLNTTAVITTNWQRFSISGAFPGATANFTYAVPFPAGTSIEVYGPQVDAQVLPSTYVPNAGSCGVYPAARFDSSQIERIATGPNRNTCIMFIRCNLPNGD